MSAHPIIDFVESKLSQPVEAQPKPDPATRSVAKGLFAGFVGGVVATAAKTVAEKIYPPRTEGQPAPPDVLAEKVSTQMTGHPTEGASKVVASETLHWVFGAAAGAVYGALTEFYPAAAARQGATFGMTLMALTHEGALPALGLSAEPAEQTTREKSSEMVTHVIFGVVAETVRKAVRQAL